MLLVVLTHGFLIGVVTHVASSTTSSTRVLGVNIFFIASGFLITALLLYENKPIVATWDSGRFYAGRALRLLPALYVLLAAHVIYVAVTNPFPFENELVSVRAAVFYYYNWQVVWNVIKTVSDLGHLWSLSIEEQFYLVWPAVLILFLGLRHRAKTVAAVLIAVIVIIAVNRALLWQHTSWRALLNRTDTQADGLFVGALLAVLWVRRRTPTRGLIPVAWIALGVMVLSVEFVRGDGSFYFDGGSTLFAVAIAAVILATLESNWPVNWLWPRPRCKNTGDLARRHQRQQTTFFSSASFVSGVTGDMTGGAAFSTTFGLHGIRLGSGTGHKVYHNSVNLFGLRSGTATASLLGPRSPSSARRRPA